jgi:WD40 repeat protein
MSPAAGRESSDAIQWSTTVKGVCALAADASGRFVAAGLASGSIQLHDAATGESIDAFHARRGTVVAVTFTADGRLVAAWDDGTVAMVAFSHTD